VVKVAAESVLEIDSGSLKSSAKISAMPCAAGGGSLGIPSFQETPP
jgi:hypothetical protein